jgi:hypothetical protein
MQDWDDAIPEDWRNDAISAYVAARSGGGRPPFRPYRASLPRAVWDSIPTSEQEIWDQMSQETKAAILNYAKNDRFDPSTGTPARPAARTPRSLQASAMTAAPAAASPRARSPALDRRSVNYSEALATLRQIDAAVAAEIPPIQNLSVEDDTFYDAHSSEAQQNLLAYVVGREPAASSSSRSPGDIRRMLSPTNSILRRNNAALPAAADPPRDNPRRDVNIVQWIDPYESDNESSDSSVLPELIPRYADNGYDSDDTDPDLPTLHRRQRAVEVDYDPPSPHITPLEGMLFRPENINRVMIRGHIDKAFRELSLLHSSTNSVTPGIWEATGSDQSRSKMLPPYAYRDDIDSDYENDSDEEPPPLEYPSPHYYSDSDDDDETSALTEIGILRGDLQPAMTFDKVFRRKGLFYTTRESMIRASKLAVDGHTRNATEEDYANMRSWTLTLCQEIQRRDIARSTPEDEFAVKSRFVVDPYSASGAARAEPYGIADAPANFPVIVFPGLDDTIVPDLPETLPAATEGTSTESTDEFFDANQTISAFNIDIVNKSYSITNFAVRKKGRTFSSLCDRGANGGVCGSDMRVINISDRQVDLSGIDNHEIKDIPIVTAAGVVSTTDGQVVVIAHQYAHVPTSKTIHSAAQLEHYNNEVHDKSSLVPGGLQHIKTFDGRIIPLSI